MSGRAFWHSGDLGDIVAALPTIRATGGGELIIGYKQNGQRESLKGGRFESLVPLLLAQPYITSVRWGDPFRGCIDFSGFRDIPNDGMNLACWQAKYVNAVVSMEPWLTVKTQHHGRAVIARSARYHNPDFPWRAIVQKLVDPIFVGLPEEHTEFCSFVGWQVEHVRCGNLLNLARLIAGAKVFVGNQSAPFWIAAALGTRAVQETWLDGRNSIIHRDGLHYPIFTGYNLDGMLR